MKRLLFGSIVGLALAAASVSVAARGSNPATIVLVPPGGGAVPTTIWPRLGDGVAFATTYPKQLDKYGVGVHLSCFQNGSLVYSETQPNTATFTLGGTSSPWRTTGGPAYCVADLYYWNSQGFNWLAGAQFTASGY